MSVTSRRLRQVLIDIGVNVPETMHIQRLFPGHRQRAAGAWVFCIFDGDNLDSIWELGSIEPATAIIAAHRKPGWKVETMQTCGGTEISTERELGL